MIKRIIDRLKTFEARNSEFSISRIEQIKTWLRFRIQTLLGSHRHFFTFTQGADYYALKPPSGDEPVCENGLPIPPRRLWFGYAETEQRYLEVGQYNTNSMTKDLEASGFPVNDCTRVLDFGCAGGRMIRWLKDIAEKGEVWGGRRQRRSYRKVQSESFTTIPLCHNNRNPAFTVRRSIF